jgi:hypothetical protein
MDQREDRPFRSVRPAAELNACAGAVVDAALQVHRTLGPGFLESAYEEALAILPVHKAQLLSYLRATGHPLGLPINFNARLLRDGITRVIWHE